MNSVSLSTQQNAVVVVMGMAARLQRDWCSLFSPYYSIELYRIEILIENINK
jgi:hypothetical protein